MASKRPIATSKLWPPPLARNTRNPTIVRFAARPSYTPPVAPPPPSSLVPIVTEDTFTLVEPVSAFDQIGTCSAANSPTNWTLIGESAVNFLIQRNTVNLFTRIDLVVGTYPLVVAASNSYGTGEGTVTVEVTAAQRDRPQPRQRR